MPSQLLGPADRNGSHHFLLGDRYAMRLLVALPVLTKDIGQFGARAFLSGCPPISADGSGSIARCWPWSYDPTASVWFSDPPRLPTDGWQNSSISIQYLIERTSQASVTGFIRRRNQFNPRGSPSSRRSKPTIIIRRVVYYWTVILTRWLMLRLGIE